MLILLAVVASLPDRATAQATQPAVMAFGMSFADLPAEPSVNETSPRTVELLGEAISSASTPARLAELIQDLGECRLPAAAKYLLPALSHREEMVRAEAVRSLGMSGDRSIAAKLEPLLTDTSPLVRREAVLAGTALGIPTFASVGISDADPVVIVAALNGSISADAKRIADHLSSWPEDVKVLAIRALARHGSIKHADAISQCLAGTVPVRCAAIDALGDLHAKQFEADVRRLLHDKHSAVRRAAIRAFAGLASEPEVFSAAVAMLSDSDAFVREAAVRVLTVHPNAAATEPLIAQLSSSSPSLRSAARDALVACGRLDISGMEGHGVALLKSTDPRRREDGSYVLGRLSSHAAIKEHIALLQDQDLLVATQAAESLGEIGNPDAAPALCELIRRVVPEAQSTGESEASSNQASRAGRAAIVACAKLGYQPLREIVKPLIGKQVSRSTPLRAAAVWAFGVVGSADDQATCQQLLVCYADAYEATTVKYEALKALGNLRYAVAESKLREIEETETFHPLRWIAHQSADRIAGVHTPFTPRPVPWTADVSIVDQTHP